MYLDRHLCCDYRVCLDMCSMGVFGVIDGVVYPVKMHLCITCLRCTEFCPAHAINTRWTVRA